ncbi:MAG: c-type cytochrome [Gemmatimonadota bacterium]
MTSSKGSRPAPLNLLLRALTLAVPVMTLACGGEGGQEAAPGAAPAAPAAAEPAALSPAELEQGIGPIRDLALGPIDPALVAEGETAFVLKCSACHKIEERYVGPRLGTVLARVRPEYAMNMMLNSNEMVQRHPRARAMLAEFFTPMTVQVTGEPEARAILEYLRSVQIDTTTTPTPSDGGDL